MLSKRLAIIVAALALLSSFALMPVVHASPSTYTGKPKLGPIGSKHLHVVGPNSFYCDPGWIYENISDRGSSFWIVAPVFSGPYPADQPNGASAYRAYNSNATSATETFSALVTGTVSVSINVSATVAASVIVASVNETLGITVTTSISTTIGHNMAISVPAHKAGYGQYGVLQKVTTGHYYYLASNCAITNDKGTVTARSPWYPNWNTWIGS